MGEESCIGESVLGGLQSEGTFIGPKKGGVGVFVVHQVMQQSQDGGSTRDEPLEIIDQAKELGEFLRGGGDAELLRGRHLVREGLDLFRRHQMS